MISLKKIKQLSSLLFEKNILMDHHEINSLSYWRTRILFSILLFSALIGFFIFISVIPMAIDEKLWGLLVFDGLIWITSIFLLTISNISFTTRATVSVCIIEGQKLGFKYPQKIADVFFL